MYGQTNGQDGGALLENRVSALETEAYATVKYADGGSPSGVTSASGAMGKVWDNLTIVDATVAGAFEYGGVWLFTAFKYLNGQYGMMFAVRFDGIARIMAVMNGTKSFYDVNKTSVG